MKKTFNFLSISLLAILLASCNNTSVSTKEDDVNPNEKVVGNGKLSSNERTIESFHAIELQGVFNVMLKQSTKEALKIETDENLQSLIQSKVDNGVLKIKLKDSTNIKNLKKIDIYINFVSIDRITTAGVGSVKCLDTLRLPSLDCKLQGVGATNLMIITNSLSVNSEMVGALFLAGNAKDLRITNKGLGAIEAFNLKTETLFLDTEGIGSAELFVTERLTIHSKGLGGVKYKGNPKQKRIQREGIGKIEAVE
jgi:hypothetical protein